MGGKVFLESEKFNSFYMSGEVSSFTQKSGLSETKQVSSSHSSLRAFKAMGSLNCVKEKAEYLDLEAKADAAYAKGFQGDYIDQFGNDYRIYSFYSEIVDQYEKAAEIAASISHFEKASSLLEKAGKIHMEELDGSGIYFLKGAWEFSKQSGNLEKTRNLLSKLLDRLDCEITLKRNEYLEKGPEECFFEGLIHHLLEKATILKLENQDGDEVDRLYEEAGNLCLTLAEHDFAFNNLFFPELIAGLAFEKVPSLEEKATATYENLIALFIEKEAEMFPITDSMGPVEEYWVRVERFIYGAPVHLQISLAALKCGRKDLFAKQIESQIKNLTSIVLLRPEVIKAEAEEDELEEDELEEYEVNRAQLAEWPYFGSFAYVSESILGADSSEFLKIKEAYSELYLAAGLKDPSHFRSPNVEAALWRIYSAGKEVSVIEMIELLEDGRFIQP